jgi:hypothetical protein
VIYIKANRAFKEAKDDNKGMIQMLPTVAFAVVMLYAIMYIGTYMNGTIGSQLIDSYGTEATRTTFENKSVSTLSNLSADYDSNTEIVSVAAIITVLTIPLMAIVAIKRLV